jgi:hypothetical protein
MVVFVLCVAGALYQVNQNRLTDVKAAAILSCNQHNVVIDAQARTVSAQKIVNRELGQFLKTSEDFRRAEGRVKLADESRRSKNKVLATNKRLVVPKKVDCEATFKVSHIIYQDGKTEPKQK